MLGIIIWLGLGQAFVGADYTSVRDFTLKFISRIRAQFYLGNFIPGTLRDALLA